MDTSGLYAVLGVDADDPVVLASEDEAVTYERLIDVLVEQRKCQRLSQKAVAELMGTTQSAVSDLERLGGDARYSTLQRYARAVGGRLSAAFVTGEPASRRSAAGSHARASIASAGS